MNTKFQLFKDLKALAISRHYRSVPESLRDVLELAYNAGYKDGRGEDPLYDARGKQIREVTQAELDWSP